MFKVAKEPTFTAPVRLKVPNEKGGCDQVQFTARFKVMPQSRLNSLIEAEAEQTALLREAVIGWDKVADEDGNPVAFTDEALAALLEISYIRIGLMGAYLEATSNGTYKLKN